ncbi:MAG: lipocalin family protein, partial [Alistipes sp.]
MKKLFTLVLAACAFYSCCNNEPKQFAGFIEDATMNNVVVKELTGDQTQTFSTATADMTQANGMLLGAPIIVDYKGNLKEVTEATKVSVDATYCNAVGEWTMPDPIDSTKVMGINLMIQGDAASVNMATMVYKSWELQGPVGKLLLHG